MNGFVHVITTITTTGTGISIMEMSIMKQRLPVEEVRESR
jgi:hypothetical protein